MRLTFSSILTELALTDSRVVLLTGDLGFQLFDNYHEQAGPRYINVGVAEAQMVLAAAGLALEGFRPFAYSIASFLTTRTYEQVKLSIGYHRLPVVLVGAGGGYAYSRSGVTHHAAEDFGLMSLIPGMTVVAPGDAGELAQLLPQLLNNEGPCYLRLGRGGEPSYAGEPAFLGKARLLAGGEKVAIATTGDLASVAVTTAARLADEGITPLVYQFHTIKPLDRETLAEIVKNVKTIIVLEEHSPVGGLYPSIAVWLAARESKARLERLGPPDIFALGNLPQPDLRSRYKYDLESLIDFCRSTWKNS
jgi:transketolase